MPRASEAASLAPSMTGIGGSINASKVTYRIHPGAVCRSGNAITVIARQRGDRQWHYKAVAVAGKIAEDGLAGIFRDKPAARARGGNAHDVAHGQLPGGRQLHGGEPGIRQQISGIHHRLGVSAAHRNPADEAVAKETADKIISAIGEGVDAGKIIRTGESLVVVEQRDVGREPRISDGASG